MKLPKDFTRSVLAVMVVGAFVAIVVAGRPLEGTAALSPLAGQVVMFFFRKKGPNGG